MFFLPIIYTKERRKIFNLFSLFKGMEAATLSPWRVKTTVNKADK